MKVASIVHGRDGYFLEVYEVPLWAVALTSLAEHVCAASRHVACHSRFLNWLMFVDWRRSRQLWRVPISRETVRERFSSSVVDWDDEHAQELHGGDATGSWSEGVSRITYSSSYDEPSGHPV